MQALVQLTLSLFAYPNVDQAQLAPPLELHALYQDSSAMHLGNDFTTAVIKSDPVRAETISYSQYLHSALEGLHRQNLSLTSANIQDMFTSSHKHMPWGIQDVSADNLKWVQESLCSDETALQQQKKTCAVVGNGGNLRGRGQGKEIDGHDVVLRCNIPPHVNSGESMYEADVGAKATHFAVKSSDPSLPTFSQREGSRLLWFIEEVQGEHGDKGFQALKSSTNPETCHRMHLTNPEFHNYIWNIWLMGKDSASLQPSTGMSALMYALGMGCGKIDVYGFGPADCQYYWDCTKGSDVYVQQRYHDFPMEAKVRQSLADANMIELHPPTDPK